MWPLQRQRGTTILEMSGDNFQNISWFISWNKWFWYPQHCSEIVSHINTSHSLFWTLNDFQMDDSMTDNHPDVTFCGWHRTLDSSNEPTSNDRNAYLWRQQSWMVDPVWEYWNPHCWRERKKEALFVCFWSVYWPRFNFQCSHKLLLPSISSAKALQLHFLTVATELPCTLRGPSFI